MRYPSSRTQEKTVSAIERVLDDLELSYVRPAYQKLGEENLRLDSTFHEFMFKDF